MLLWAVAAAPVRGGRAVLRKRFTHAAVTCARDLTCVAPLPLCPLAPLGSCTTCSTSVRIKQGFSFNKNKRRCGRPVPIMIKFDVACTCAVRAGAAPSRLPSAPPPPTRDGAAPARGSRPPHAVPRDPRLPHTPLRFRCLGATGLLRDAEPRGDLNPPCSSSRESRELTELAADDGCVHAEEGFLGGVPKTRLPAKPPPAVPPHCKLRRLCSRFARIAPASD